jgi:hypothetical protein
MARTASIVALLSAFALNAGAQSLLCPGSNPAGCPKTHFHIRIWSPETKNVTEMTGINRFASTEACELERQRQETANADAIRFLATAAPRMKTQPNRYGPCHCDMTDEPSNPLYLDTMKRVSQLRLEQQTRSELLLELFEKKLPTDSELATALSNAPSRLHPATMARTGVIPTASGSHLLGPVQLKDTSVSGAAKDGNWQSELKLVEVRIARTAEGEAPAPVAADQNAFITSETARIREIVLTTAQGDSENKGSILQAAAERMQLLSKLGRLIESAGPQSTLATAATAATEHAGSRRSFIAMLFGPQAADHWDPADPAMMALTVPAEISADPVAVLRDTSNRFGPDQKKQALYAFLLQNPLVESDEPWLSSIAESHLEETP